MGHLIGLVVGNVFGMFRWFSIFAAGIDTYELFLKIGIALLGVRFVFGDILKLGGLSLVLIALEFAIAGRAHGVAGKALRARAQAHALLAIGSSVCGVSAIIAAQGSITPTSRTRRMPSAPSWRWERWGCSCFRSSATLAHELARFRPVGRARHRQHRRGRSGGQLYSEEAGKWAVLAKTARNATIGFVVLG